MKNNTNYNDSGDVYIQRYNTFFSAKNNAEIFYETEHEYWLIGQFEREPAIRKYEKFYLPIFDNKTGSLIEDCTGFVVERDDYCGYVVISDYLTDNPNYREQVERLLNGGKKERGEVEVLPRRVTKFKDMEPLF